MLSRDAIKVVCRMRPENKLEKEGNYARCVEFDKKNIRVTVAGEHKAGDMEGSHPFAFDRVFGPNTQQQEVFDEVALPVIRGRRRWGERAQGCWKATTGRSSRTDRLLRARPGRWR